MENVGGARMKKGTWEREGRYTADGGGRCGVVRCVVLYLSDTNCICCGHGEHVVGVRRLVLLWQHLVCSLFAHTYLCLCSTLGPHSQTEGVKWEHVCADHAVCWLPLVSWPKYQDQRWPCTQTTSFPSSLTSLISTATVLGLHLTCPL